MITCTAVDDERDKRVVRYRLARWNRSECWPWRARLALSYRARLYRPLLPGCFSPGRRVDVCLLLCGWGGGGGLFDVVRVYRPGLFSRGRQGVVCLLLGARRRFGGVGMLKPDFTFIYFGGDSRLLLLLLLLSGIYFVTTFAYFRCSYHC